MFTSIKVQDLDDNCFKSIGDEWLLICCDDEKNKRENMMTASWGGMGILWNLPVCFLFVRPQRYTHELLKDCERFSVCVLPEALHGAHRICGSQSGRDVDKPAETGLTEDTLDGVKIIREARTVFVVKKLYVDTLRKDKFIDPSPLKHYPSDDFHTVYVCEIEKVYLNHQESV